MAGTAHGDPAAFMSTLGDRRPGEPPAAARDESLRAPAMTRGGAVMAMKMSVAARPFPVSEREDLLIKARVGSRSSVRDEYIDYLLERWRGAAPSQLLVSGDQGHGLPGQPRQAAHLWASISDARGCAEGSARRRFDRSQCGCSATRTPLTRRTDQGKDVRARCPYLEALVEQVGAFASMLTG